MKTLKTILRTILFTLVVLFALGYYLVNQETHKREVKSPTSTLTEVSATVPEVKAEPITKAQPKTQAPETKPAPQTQTIQAIETNVEQVLQVYEYNEIAADEVLKGKLVKLTGEIKSIEKVFGGGVIYLKGTNDFNAARCYIKDSELKRAATLSPNTIISLTGKFDGISFGGPVMRNCEID